MFCCSNLTCEDYTLFCPFIVTGRSVFNHKTASRIVNFICLLED
jgi:hypothetical protein